MKIRFIGTVALAIALLDSANLNLNAQAARTTKVHSASQVTAEVTKGRLSSEQSEPGDMIIVRLKNDVRSNGEVVLKKGSEITGVVRNVKRADAQGPSMMQIEWIAPAAEVRAGRSLSLALQSVTQVNPIYRDEQETVMDNELLFAGRSAAPMSAAPAPSIALLSMPSVIAADSQTSAAVVSSLGASLPGPLYQVGRGRLAAGGGMQQPVEIFSYLNNDTIISSSSRNFEIAGGAQMQFLVGVNKK